MSVVVSYKKQIVFGIFLIVILLATVELFVNIWLYNFYKCEFEDNEIFRDTDSETKRRICLETIGLENENEFIKFARYTDPSRTIDRNDINRNIIFLNSEGFRSPEFSKEKPENTYRIFILGGSSSFGTGVLDDETYPFYLQKLYDETNLDFKVEVINTGWVLWQSEQETKLIKERLLDYEPDLFFVYDGWNELNKQFRKNSPNHSPVQWKDRWIEICELGKQRGFETIITLQPIVGTGNKVLTYQEHQSRLRHWMDKFLETYPSYVEQLNELQQSCTLTADLRNIFDYVEGPIYFDVGHVGPKGNQIVADTLYTLSLPIVIDGTKSRDLSTIYEIDDAKGTNIDLISNVENNSLNEKVYFTLRNLISNYKTPKLIPMIFE